MTDSTETPSIRRASRLRRAISSPGKVGLETVLAEMDELIGLENVKDEIYLLMHLGKVVALRRERDLPVANLNLHMIFSGPPGTGKTEVARKVGKILAATGLLKRGHCVEIDRSAVTSSFVNSGPQLIRDKALEAVDGVLFIDEAYALTGTDAGDQADKSGTEVIDALIRIMEDYRDRLVVIFAGYEADMERFLRKANTGLSSRVSRKIRFESYNADQLFEIFKKIASKHHYTMDAQAEEAAWKHIRDLSQDGLNGPAEVREKFGNAREIRNFFERILPIQAERIALTPNFEQMPNEELIAITVEDIEMAVLQREGKA